MARAAVIPQSPPKRVGRGRPKAATTTAGKSSAAVTASTKPPSRTTKAKAPTTATGTRKRTTRTALTTTNTRPDPETDGGTDDELGIIETKEKSKPGRPKGKPSTTSATSTAGRGRKPAVAPAPETESDDDEDELAQSDAPKKRVGRPRTKPLPKDNETKTETAPRPRGRPRSNTTTKQTTSTDTEKESTKKKTRAKTSVEETSQSNSRYVVITTSSATMRSNMLRGPAKKKTVTFQDLSDSDDEEACESAVPTTGRRKGATATTQKAGLGAKPVRKPATTSGRGRKLAVTKKDSTKPLSPKKATQVAKSISSYASSDSEDDELAGIKDPIKLVVSYPHKTGSEHTGLSSPVRKINFTTNKPPNPVDENGEPTLKPRRSIDFNDSIFMSSPARRPTPSPFQFTMKETPRRGGFGLRDEKPVPQPNFTPSQNSPLKMSAKKARLETPRHDIFNLHGDSKPLSQPNFTPGHNSPLKSSPRKGLFGASFSQTSLQESTDSFKSRSFLLQSPAKRTASPFKSSASLIKPPASETPQSKADSDDDLNADATPKAHDSPLGPLELEDEMGIEDGNEEEDDAAPEEDYPSSSLQTEAQYHDIMDDETNEYNAPHDVEHMLDDDIDEQSSDYDGENAEDEVEDVKDHEDYVDKHVDEQVEEDFDESDEEHVPENPVDDVEVIENNDQDDADNVQDKVEGIAQEDFEILSEDHTAEASEHGAEECLDDEANGDVWTIPGQEVAEFEEALENGDNAVALDVEDDLDSFETHPESESESEPEEYMDQAADENSDVGKNSELSQALRRQSLVEGLEDVFIDLPAASESVHHDLEVEGVEQMIDSTHDESSEEGDGFSDASFDDDEATLVAFDTTAQGTFHPQPVPSPEVVQARRTTIPAHGAQDIQSPAPSPPVNSAIDYHGNMEFRDGDIPSDTEFTTEIENHTREEFGYPESSTHAESENLNREQPSTDGKRPRFTLLAEQINQWKASSPEKAQPRRSRRRGVFSTGELGRPSTDIPHVSGEVSYPDITENSTADVQRSYPDGPGDSDANGGDPELSQEPDETESEMVGEGPLEAEGSPSKPMGETSSDAPIETFEPSTHGYDQNPHISDQDMSPGVAFPSFSEALSDDDKENETTPLPPPVTPILTKSISLQTFHTVSKVPLKPEGQESPLRISRKRGRSLSLASPVRSSPRLRNSNLVPKEQSIPSYSPRKAPKLQHNSTPKSRPSSPRRKSVMNPVGPSKRPSASPSPTKTPRRNISACEQVLKGAVVYVDVHTTEGEDASGIFVELLQQMGARCVKNWAWNPRSSVSPVEQAEQKDGKVGITHVVFKDGGVRTLEKVKHAAGLVKCVGVGWVLDCEREKKWLDEKNYAVDSSIIPRGGAKRRKSMEPRALSNINGTLVKVETTSASASGKRSGVDRNTMEDFMKHTPPVSSDEPATPESSKNYNVDHTEADQEYCQTPKTPGSFSYDFSKLDNIGMSPATPFYLSQRSKLVQQTCPPKQTRQGLFAPSGPLDDEPTQTLRFKLEAARRKSLAFKPKVGSPLTQ